MDLITPPESSSPDTIHRTVDLDVTADEMWQLVSDADRLAEWLADEVDLTVEPGATGTIVDDGVSRFVHVDHVDAGRSIEFTWWETDGQAPPSRVRFDIVPATAGSRLLITETLCTTEPAHTRGERSGLPSGSPERSWDVRICTLWLCSVVAALVG